MTAILLKAAIQNPHVDRLHRVFTVIFVGSVKGAMRSERSETHNVLLALRDFPRIATNVRPDRIAEGRLPPFVLDRDLEDIMPWLKENVTERCEAIARYEDESILPTSGAPRHNDWTTGRKLIPILSLNFTSATDAVNCKLRFG